MAALPIYINPNVQYFDNNGLVLNAGKLYFYTAGTTTPLDTYSDSDGLVPNTNPVVLDSAGRAGAIYLQNTGYKVVLKTSADVQIWSRDNVWSPATTSILAAEEVTFTQTSGNGTYTGSVSIAAGITLVDIIVSAVALWDGTSASMNVGDGNDADGYFTAVDLVATDLLANESISFSEAGGVGGAYLVNSHVLNRYSASSRTITATVTQVGTGTLGRTRMTVLTSNPSSADITAATKA